MKIIAWGASPLLELYQKFSSGPKISYCIDSAESRHGTNVFGVDIYPPSALDKEDKENLQVVIFAMSSQALQSIQDALTARGFITGLNCVDFATFVKDDFQSRAAKAFGHNLDPHLFNYARALNYTSTVPLETTIHGNWLLLESLRSTAKLDGAIVEIGAFQCGNSCLLLNAMELWGDTRPYYIMDSFEGFSTLSKNDPEHRAADYAYDYKLNHILNRMRLYEQAHVIPGFVPSTFSQLNNKEKYSLVFYDCDLYQPALDCYEYFWPRLLPGGILVIHDNIATGDGWIGVRKATDEFFKPKGIEYHDFWETTMSVIFKPR